MYRRHTNEYGWLCLWPPYILATFKVISGHVPTCNSVHSWWLYSVAPLGDQAISILTWYPTPLSHICTQCIHTYMYIMYPYRYVRNISRRICVYYIHPHMYIMYPYKYVCNISQHICTIYPYIYVYIICIHIRTLSIHLYTMIPCQQVHYVSIGTYYIHTYVHICTHSIHTYMYFMYL